VVYSSFRFQRKAEQSFPFTKAKQARGLMSASRSSGYAVSRQIFLSLRCERIYRENLASDRPMQKKPLQTETTAPPPTDRKGKIIYGEFELGKCRMFGTFDKVSIVGSLSQVGIMKILIIVREEYTTIFLYIHSNMARYVLSYSKPFGLLPKVCPHEHSKMSFQPLKKI